MKKFTLLLFCLIFSGFASGKPVTIEIAQQAAIHYYQNYAKEGITDFSVKESFTTEYNGLTTYYTFNFSAGGFVIVSADNAVVPVLGYSQSGYIEKKISNPAAKAWFDGYNLQIFNIVQARPDNTSTLQEWNNILNGRFNKSARKIVGPLISSIWDQNEWIISIARLTVTVREAKLMQVVWQLLVA